MTVNPLTCTVCESFEMSVWAATAITNIKLNISFFLFAHTDPAEPAAGKASQHCESILDFREILFFFWLKINKHLLIFVCIGLKFHPLCEAQSEDGQPQVWRSSDSLTAAVLRWDQNTYSAFSVESRYIHTLYFSLLTPPAEILKHRIRICHQKLSK